MDCKVCNFRSQAARYLQMEELEYLSKNCAEVHLRPGDNIIREGSLSSHIIYIKEGLAKIHKDGPQNEDHLLKLAGPGAYIGIQTILADKVHQYSVSALENSLVCFIDSLSFKELIRRNPSFSYELILYLCREEINFYDRVAALSNRQVHGRLAQSILHIARMKGSLDKSFHLPLSRKELASMINASRESVSRALQEMVNSQIIRLKGRDIEITSLEILEKISKSG